MTKNVVAEVGEVQKNTVVLPVEAIQAELMEFLDSAKLNTASDFLRLNFIITKAVLAGVISPSQANATAANLRNNLKLMELQFRVARIYAGGKDEKNRNLLPDVQLYSETPAISLDTK